MENIKPESKIMQETEKTPKTSIGNLENIRSPKLQMTDRFISRLISKRERDWRNQDGSPDSYSVNYIKLLRESYKQGDYIFTVGQLLLEEESLEGQKEEYIKKDNMTAFNGEKRDLMMAESVLAENMFPEIKSITLDYLEEYSLGASSEYAKKARVLGLTTESGMKYGRKVESLRGISTIILEGSEVDIEDCKKVKNFLSEEIKEKESDMTAEYARMINYKFHKDDEKGEDIKHLKTFKKEIETLFKLKKVLEIIERKIYGTAETKSEQQKIDELRSELENEKGKEIKPHLLSPSEMGEVFSKFFEKKERGYEPKKDVMKIPFSEDDKRNYLMHVLGVIQQIKIELSKLKEKGNNNVRSPATVAGILGNGGIGVGILQILLTEKRGYVSGHISFEKVLALDLRGAIKEAVGYEIKDPDWESYFSH